MSSASVTTTQRHIMGSLNWEVKDLHLHFRFCKSCSKEERHYCSMKLESAVMKIDEGTGKSTKWKLQFQRNCTQGRGGTYSVKTLSLCILFCGMFDESKSSQIPAKFDYMYDVTVFGGPADNMKEITSFSDTYSKLKKEDEAVIGDVCSLSSFFDPKNGMWPNGNLKVTVKLLRLLGTNHEVVDGSQNDKIVKHLSANPFGPLFNNPHLSDVKILCGDSTFYAHKLLLSVRSRVFCAMLGAEMLESQSKEIKITDLEPNTVEMMLKYFYTGEIIIPQDYKDLLELLDCAEKYDLEELKSACLKKMTSTIGDHNVGEFAIAADMYNASPSALAVIKNYCMKNHERLMGNAEYKKMFLANPQAFIR